MQDRPFTNQFWSNLLNCIPSHKPIISSNSHPTLISFLNVLLNEHFTVININLISMRKTLALVALLFTMTISMEGVFELNDANFEQMVTKDSAIWAVLFSAEWCGHCTELKPEIEKLAPKLQKLGLKVGHVNQKNNPKLINQHVVDHNTHMVSYPKFKVFLGSELLIQVPSGLRNAEQLYFWFVKQYNLQENMEEEL